MTALNSSGASTVVSLKLKLILANKKTSTAPVQSLTVAELRLQDDEFEEVAEEIEENMETDTS